MSTARVSRRDVLDPGKGGVITQKRRARAHRTQISKIYRESSAELVPEKRKHSPRLDPLDKTVMSLELLNQYNNIVGQEDSLAYKRLPPVKLSYQPTKKFMESPRTDYSSRIIRPHLTMKTYSPGHHIFTEGISSNSEMPSPTFALQRVGVPYSNLPDNIAVYKEKDKFAFTVNREEYDKSPYRLTPRPYLMGTGQLITDIHTKIVIPSLDQDTVELSERSGKTTGKRKTGRSSISLKSNVIKLEPLSGGEGSDSGYNTQEHVPSSGTVMLSDRRGTTSLKTIDETKSCSERKLSVVSVGETVAQDFFSKYQREARQQYPMYDNSRRKVELFRRDKFGHAIRDHSRPRIPKSTFTYKVCTRDHSFVQASSPDKFRPIKNNLRDRFGNPINKQRGLGRFGDNSDTKEDKTSTDYNFRRYYSRSFHLPNSAGSNSTDMTHLPGNPPPSEISHIISEEGLPMMVNDGRSEMVTLHEERTMTASMMSYKGGDDTDKKCMDSLVESPVPPFDDKATARTNATYTTTDTEMQFEAAERLTEQAERDRINAMRKEEENIVNQPISENEENIPEEGLAYVELHEAELTIMEGPEFQYLDADTGKVEKAGPSDETEVVQEATVMPDKDEHTEKRQDTRERELPPIYANTNDEDVLSESSKKSASKLTLSVPRLSLDDKLELPMIAERTSFSRKIQSLPVLEKEQSDETNDNNKEKQNAKELILTVHIPITRLRLFSESSNGSVCTPGICITDENGEDQELETISEDPDKMDGNEFLLPLEKRPINNSNVKFIYPSSSDIKAKRQ